MNEIRARVLLEQIARMTMDGEAVGGEFFEMDLEDAATTLNRLIQEARNALRCDPNPSSMAVIATGNPFDGISLYGPYLDVVAANQAAETIRSSKEWWVSELRDLET